MKKKSRILFIIAAVLLAGAYYVYASFEGSIIIKAVTTAKVNSYVKEHYAEEPFEVQFCRYDFKAMGYYCPVKSTQSEDTHFIVWNGSDGLTDDYEISVERRDNTIMRLSIAIDDYLEGFMKENYPHRTSLILADCSSTVTEEHRRQVPLDMPFDPKNFPLSCQMTVWVETAHSEPTWEELAERFRELEALVRDELPCIETFSISLQAPYIEENGEYVPENYSHDVCAFDVSREVILSDGLEVYLAEVKAVQDAEKEAIANGEKSDK